VPDYAEQNVPPVGTAATLSAADPGAFCFVQHDEAMSAAPYEVAVSDQPKSHFGQLSGVPVAVRRRLPIAIAEPRELVDGAMLVPGKRCDCVRHGGDISHQDRRVAFAVLRHTPTALERAHDRCDAVSRIGQRGRRPRSGSSRGQQTAGPLHGEF
jgi:hypothetical protein